MALDVTLCCLCLKTSELLLDIFEEQCNHKSLAVIISQHFWFDVKREEAVKKGVCAECWSNVDNFHTFYSHVYTIHNDFYARTHDEIKVEIDDPQEVKVGNKSERKASIETPFDHEVGKFEILIINENNELSNVNFKVEEPSFEGADESYNTQSELIEQTPKVKSCQKKNKSQKFREIDPIIEGKIVEPSFDNFQVENVEIEKIDESINNVDDISETKLKLPKQTTVTKIDESDVSTDEEISDNSNDSFSADADDIQDNDDDDCSSSDSDASVQRTKVKSPKTKNSKSSDIEPAEAQAKIEEENVQIRERFPMECELCKFHFESFNHAQAHYRKTHKQLGYLRCCDTKFSSRPLILEHIQRHLSPDDFKCGQCNKYFVRKRSLKEHMLRHLAIEDKPFKCPKCPKSYIRNFLLRRHLGTHELENQEVKEYRFEDFGESNNSGLDESTAELKENNTKKRKPEFPREIDPELEAKIAEEDEQIRAQFPMECEICYRPFTTFYDAQSHYRNKHHRTGYLRCCNAKYITRPTVLEHLRRHIAPAEFRCNECDKYFATKRKLAEHIERHLPLDARPFKCTECPKTFTRQYFLNKHLELHQGLPKDASLKTLPKWKCDKCGKDYGTKILLGIHIKDRHERSAQHICDVCARVFPNKNDFDKHHRNKHEKHAKVQCNVCGAWLKTKLYLKRHMYRHQDIEKMLPCTECDKKFPLQKALRDHMMSVHPKEMFSCNLCDKQFKSRVSLKEHLANHSGFSLYKCPHCPKTFSIRATMYSHRKQMHKAEWEEHLKMKAAGLD